MLQEHLLHGIMSTEKVKRFCRNIINSADLERVWIHPIHIPIVRKGLENSQIKIGTIIDFPLGSCPSKIKAAIATELKSMGVDELGLMVFGGYIEDKKWADLEAEVKLILNTIGNIPLKLVVNPTPLEPEQIKQLDKLAKGLKLELMQLRDGYLVDQYQTRI